jgi:hypothetical protein
MPEDEFLGSLVDHQMVKELPFSVLLSEVGEGRRELMREATAELGRAREKRLSCRKVLAFLSVPEIAILDVTGNRRSLGIERRRRAAS